MVEDRVVVEIKSVSVVLPVLVAQLMTYMRDAEEIDRAADQFQFAVLEGRDQRRVL